MRHTRKSDLTVNVPSDGGTLRETLTAASEIVSPKNGVRVIVNIESGHTITDPIRMSNGDYSYIRIDSEDSQVSADVDTDLFFFADCVAPEINTVFDLGGDGNDGLVYRNSRGIIEDGSGAVNAGRNCLKVRRGSQVDAFGGVFTGATNHGVHVTTASQLSGQSIDASGAGDKCLFVSRGSIAHCISATLNNAGETAVDCRRSLAVVESATIDGGGTGITASDSSGSTTGFVVATRITIKNISGSAISVNNAGQVFATEAQITDIDTLDIAEAGDGGSIYLQGATIDCQASRSLIRTANGGYVDAQEATLKNSGDVAAYCVTPGTMNLYNVEFSGNSGNAVECWRGSIIWAHGSTVDGSAITQSDTNLSALNSIAKENDTEYGIIWA